MKQIYIGIFLLFSTSFVKAQEARFEWVKQFGSDLGVINKAVTTDIFGNVYTTGAFGSTADFDPVGDNYMLTALGADGDIFISKQDTAGNLIWVKSFAGTEKEVGIDIALDEAGNLYITGYFEGTVDFDPGVGEFNLNSEGENDFFISKLNSEGNFIWAVSFGGVGKDYSASIELDDFGNVHIAGNFRETLDFDPGVEVYMLGAPGAKHIFICKLDTNGSFIWAKQFEVANSASVLNSMTLDDFGNVYSTGEFVQQIDMDPGPDISLLEANGNNSFVSKLDIDGNFVWAKLLGSGGLAESHSIGVDDAGNVYTTGKFAWTGDFDPGPEVYSLGAGSNNFTFISKLDINGNFVWAESINASNGDLLALDRNSNIYIAGTFSGLVDFDPGTGTYYIENSGLTNTYVLKLNTQGEFVEVYAMGSYSSTVAQGLNIDVFGNIYTTGYFYGSSDFDPGPEEAILNSFGAADAFVHKMSQCILPAAITSNQSLDACYGDSIFLSAHLLSAIATDTLWAGANVTSYTWSNGDSTQYIMADSEKNNSYAVTITYGGNCMASDSVEVVVNELPEVIIEGETEVCPAKNTILLASGGGNYLWSTGEETKELQIAPTSNSQYIVTVTDNNGCAATDSINLQVDEQHCPPCAVIPNAFTPNGDGINDVFRVLPGEEIEVLDFRVYNRWGNLVHNNIQPWNGKWKGEPQAMDVYVFFVQVQSYCGLKEIRGEVTLIR